MSCFRQLQTLSDGVAIAFDIRDVAAELSRMLAAQEIPATHVQLVRALLER